jgi:signal transduction histidine kinase
LGLAMAKRIFDAHDIRIVINSEEKKGSTITLRFPFRSTAKI